MGSVLQEVTMPVRSLLLLLAAGNLLAAEAGTGAVRATGFG